MRFENCTCGCAESAKDAVARLRDELSWLRIEADKLLLENRALRREIDFWSSKV